MSEETKEKSAPVAQTAPAGKKPVLLIVVAVIVACVAVLGAGTALAARSNKNVPVFSDLLEMSEKVFVSDAKYAKSVQENLNDAMLSALSPMVSKDSAFGAMFDSKVTEDDIKEMVSNYIKVESLKYEADLIVDVKEKGRGSEALLAGTGTARLEANVTGEAKMDKDDMQLSMDIDAKVKAEDMTMSASGAIRMVNDKLYMKLEKFPELGFDVSSIKGKWLVLDLEDAGDMTNEFVEPESDFGKDDLEKMSKIINSDVIANNIERLPDEVIGGVRTKCYKLAMDGSEFAELMKVAAEVMDEEITKDDMDEIAKSLNKFEIEICQGRVDGLVYRMKLVVDFEDEGSAGYVEFEMKSWDFNKEVNIEEPKGAESLEEAIGGLMGGLYGGYDDYGWDDSDWEDYDWDDSDWEDFNWDDYDL